MKYLHKYIKKYVKQFLVAILFLSIESICDLMLPTIMSKIVDIGVKNNDLTYVFRMIVLMIIITAAGAIGAIIRNIISGSVSQSFGSDLRLDLFKKINYLSFRQLDDFNSSSLITRLTNDVTQMQNFSNRLMRIFVKAPILCIGSLIISFGLNSKLALIFIFIIPIITILIYINMKVSYPFYLKMQDALDKVNGMMKEYLSGVRVVKAFNRGKYEEDRFKTVSEKFSHISKKALRINAFFAPTIGLVVNIGIVIVLWIGGIGVNNGTMKVGEIIAFINYMTKILFSLMMISSVFTTFIKAKASAERIGEIFNVENNVVEQKVIQNNNILNEIKGKISFEDVSFSISKDNTENILSNITFSCDDLEDLGIIGPTGSGKSTLVSLIVGFYKINSGKILIDDIDINEINESKLRNSIALVPQKVLLFSGSILDNIRWGKEDATLEEIQEVCRIAEINEFILSLPEQYNTIIGQRGVNLSGGQKQRISIARALIRKPKILIMDDCTSALDGTTESRIKENIKEFSKNTTCITIAQRINSIKKSDKILVLENGKVLGVGTHKELKNSCKVYEDIIKSQL